MKAFPAKWLTPVGASCFVHLMSQRPGDTLKSVLQTVSNLVIIQSGWGGGGGGGTDQMWRRAFFIIQHSCCAGTGNLSGFNICFPERSSHEAPQRWKNFPLSSVCLCWQLDLLRPSAAWCQEAWESEGLPTHSQSPGLRLVLQLWANVYMRSSHG